MKIKSQTAQKWLYCLSFEYNDIKNDIFIDEHKQLDIVEDQKKILNKIKELGLYLVKLNKNSVIKNKIYKSD